MDLVTRSKLQKNEKEVICKTSDHFCQNLQETEEKDKQNRNLIKIMKKKNKRGEMSSVKTNNHIAKKVGTS